MVLPAIVGGIASFLGWVGVDLGISWLTKDDTSIEYVSGLDFSTFVENYWFFALLYLVIIVFGIWIAYPKQRSKLNNGRGRRSFGRVRSR